MLSNFPVELQEKSGKKFYRIPGRAIFNLKGAFSIFMRRKRNLNFVHQIGHQIARLLWSKRIQQPFGHE